jgi:hypothetical protein
VLAARGQVQALRVLQRLTLVAGVVLVMKQEEMLVLGVLVVAVLELNLLVSQELVAQPIQAAVVEAREMAAQLALGVLVL